VAPRLPSFDSSAVGSFDYDVVHDEWTWSPELFLRRGLDPTSDSPSTEAFFAGLHEDDRESVRAALDTAATQGLPFACRYRVVQPGRPTASILMVGDAATGDDGAVTLHGYAIDLTDLLETEASAAVEQSARHRAAIEQVKGALMHTYGIDADEAFDVLRSYSNTLNLRLATLAELVAAAMSAPSAGRPAVRRGQGGTLLDLIARAGGSDDHATAVVHTPVDGAPQPHADARQAARE
jgi:hypothetical protein